MALEAGWADAVRELRFGCRRPRFPCQLKVPANRIGFTVMTLPQLKILQEAIALLVFAPFAVLYMKQPINLNYLWASLCVVGAVFFMFRAQGGGQPRGRDFT